MDEERMWKKSNGLNKLYDLNLQSRIVAFFRAEIFQGLLRNHEGTRHESTH